MTTTQRRATKRTLPRVGRRATAVVAVRHQNRLTFVALQKQEQRHDELQAEWGRLMLERATWTRQHSVVDDARKRFGMVAPSPERIVTLQLATGE